jgi:crossover junction endodeoxyribonuclease RuvC
VLILGIDPGTAVTGYGVVRTGASHELIECGVIRTRADRPLPERLHDISEGIRELITRHRPDTMAVEDIFYARNVRTSLVLGHARGVILLAGQEAGLAIHEYPPAEVKKAITGTGSATKVQIQFMVAKLLRLKQAPQPADAADGVAAALTCAMRAPFAKALARVAR